MTWVTRRFAPVLSRDSFAIVHYRYMCKDRGRCWFYTRASVSVQHLGCLSDCHQRPQFCVWPERQEGLSRDRKDCEVVLVCTMTTPSPRSGELRTQKLKCRPVRTQSLKVRPLKHRVGQYIAMHATLTAMDFFLISTLPVHSPAFFSKTSREFFLCWLWLTPVPF